VAVSHLQFLPHDATQSTVLLWQVVRPSVRGVEVSWSHWGSLWTPHA